ncbi:hypothetical protein PtoMrB4_50400 [Metapseudomonas otitidis]|uniref:Uncharacterized protein n=1 Tax=Metapseudomonas otitidis TaxID=319939 RepID=A0A679GJS2_9GAMM|nr:hypothetical protein PtoMrB4_50400 [Pseudomonas otitidis]
MGLAPGLAPQNTQTERKVMIGSWRKKARKITDFAPVPEAAHGRSFRTVGTRRVQSAQVPLAPAA